MPPLHHCPKCRRRTFTLVKLIQHIGLVHAHEPGFSITCGIGECQSTFSQFHSFRKHVYRKHKCSVYRSSDTEGYSDDTSVEQHSLYLDAQDSDIDPWAPDPQIVKPNLDKLLEEFKDNMFKFVLKCREKNLLHLSVQQEITDDVQFLLCFFF